MSSDGCQRRILGCALWTLTGILLMVSSSEAGKTSAARVKVFAAAGTIDDSGKQMVTVTLVIDKTWHVYANPIKWVGYESLQTVISVHAAVQPARVDVQYPAGRLYLDKRFPDLKPMVYEERIDIPVVVQRVKGDVSPLNLAVTFCACDANSCLSAATEKIVLK